MSQIVQKLYSFETNDCSYLPDTKVVPAPDEKIYLVAINIKR